MVQSSDRDTMMLRGHRSDGMFFFNSISCEVGQTSYCFLFLFVVVVDVIHQMNCKHHSQLEPDDLVSFPNVFGADRID